VTGVRDGAAEGVRLPDCLDVAARNWPERLALMFDDQRWSFRELTAAVAPAADRLAPLLADRPGRLGILSTNRPGFVFAVHAARRLGAAFVPLNWRLTSEELAWQIANAGISVLVVDDARMAPAAVATAGQAVAIVSVAELESADRQVPLQQDEQSGSFRAREESRYPAEPEPPEDRDASFVGMTRSGRGAAHGQPCTIATERELAVIYTSGTSGRPKGARLSYGNFWFSAVASSLHLGHHLNDSWLAVLPLFHVGGLSILFRGAITGVPVHLQDRFDPVRTIAAIDDGVTLVSLVPTMLARLIHARGDHPWPESLRCVLLGGAPAPPSLITECRDRGIPVAPTYGLTEAASQAATLLPEEVAAKLGSSGRPLPLTQVRIATENESARPGELGEIEIGGSTLFAGYLGQEAAPGLAAQDRWFATGDVGYLDDDGYLYVVDRRDDLIVSGGENVYPVEVERVLLEHPEVSDAGVIGIPDDVWGSRPAAVVVWSGPTDTATEALTAHCRQRLAPYKIPVRFVVIDELPRSASGKLLRRHLREWLVNPSA
jgi:o-succinylbenzoate---CoA ligase